MPRKPPLDPVREADEAIADLAESAWGFSRTYKRLAVPVIRELLGRAPTEAMHVFLTLAVDRDAKDAALATGWARAIQGIADLETINRLESAPVQAKLRAIARNKRLLPAIQGAAARGANVTDQMLAVLVCDGSDVSFDALIPHLDAGDNAHRLDMLHKLRLYAKPKATPALRALFAELDVGVAKAGAPALRIARLCGLPEAKGFWFDARVSSDVPGNYIPPVQIAVAVDSRKAAWFDVSVGLVAELKHSSFTHAWMHDELGVGRCDADGLPAWLAGVAHKLRTTWGRPYISSSVRGAKREQIAAWLIPPPAPASAATSRARRR